MERSKILPLMDLNSLDASIASANKQLQQFCRGKLLFTRYCSCSNVLLVEIIVSHNHIPTMEVFYVFPSISR